LTKANRHNALFLFIVLGIFLGSESKAQSIPRTYRQNINSHRSTGLVSLYPNPASKTIEIENKTANFDLSIFNSMGQILLESREISYTNIDISDWNKGLYFAKITCTTHSEILEFIVEKNA
jgi:sensor histidine kinase YesM